MADKTIADHLAGKPAYTIELYKHFIAMFETVGAIEVSAAKTMIGISNLHKRITWITQFGKNFIHVVFPFSKPHPGNLCFTKIVQVPGTEQCNHHFRMLYKEDVNDEVMRFMQMAYDEKE